MPEDFWCVHFQCGWTNLFQVTIVISSWPECIFPHIWHRFCLLDGSTLGLIHNPSQSNYDESMSWIYSSISCAVWCRMALFTSTANGILFFFLTTTFYPLVISVTIVIFKFQIMLLSLWLSDFPQRSRKWQFNPALLSDDKSESRVYEEGDNLFFNLLTRLIWSYGMPLRLTLGDTSHPTQLK